MLRAQITDKLKDAMRAKDERATSTLRMVLAAIKTKDIDARPSGNADGIGDEQILSLLQTLIKQRRESVALFEQGGRLELAQQEKEEIAVIETFLPAQMDENAITAAIQSAIKESAAASVKDMGKVMAILKTKFSGQMDFASVSGKVKSALGG